MSATAADIDTPIRVLVIDDDAAFRFAISKALRRQRYDVDEAASGEEALTRLSHADPPDVALLDLRMKGIDGLEVLRRRGVCRTAMVVLTGHGTVDSAVSAMKLGAFSFLEKPVDLEALGPTLRQAAGESRASLRGGERDAPPLVGVGHAIQEVRRFISMVGPTDETVMVYGETGTGKEVVARHIHLASKRREGPFVAMNAACVPRDLFESELFGHKRGAFTGATQDRLGLFREAVGGTLFIDELAELPIESQAKLLRALETKRIRPVGDSGELPVDVRIVAATNRDLWLETRAGRFREDLYFRLQVFPVVLPPLRDRPEDLAALAQHLMTRLGPGQPALCSDVTQALASHDWPGNVRELLNVLRRASLFAEGDVVGGDLIRRMIAASVFGHAGIERGASAPPSTPLLTQPATGASLADVERAHIGKVLEAMGGNVTRAAVALGIDRRTLQRKLRGTGLGDE